MGGEGEAAGDVLTGAIVAGTVEGNTGAVPGQAGEGATGTCRNCGATLGGAYCSMCGQRAKLHRSLLSLGHEIVHGILHFEGKLWRTIPELFFHPGRLTRRYIDGERVKFISPMGLFLFTVFLMFAVFSMMSGGDSVLDDGGDVNDAVASFSKDWKSRNHAAMEATDEKMAAIRKELDAEGLSAEQRATRLKDLDELESARKVMNALAEGDLDELQAAAEAGDEQAAQGQLAQGESKKNRVDIGLWPSMERRLEAGIEQAQKNPSLLIYKLKINAYKISWALIPLSIPFLWLMFFWRRDVRLYDHAIFVTYSISFMMLFLVLLALASAIGISSAIWGTALAFVPPIHLYKQLRHTYKLSRFGAFVRLWLMIFVVIFVLTIFAIVLFIVGVLD
jgi:hypothetical protein